MKNRIMDLAETVFALCFLFFVVIGISSNNEIAEGRIEAASVPVRPDGSVVSVRDYVLSHLKYPETYKSLYWSRVIYIPEIGRYIVRNTYLAAASNGHLAIYDKAFFMGTDQKVAYVRNY